MPVPPIVVFVNLTARELYVGRPGRVPSRWSKSDVVLRSETRALPPREREAFLDAYTSSYRALGYKRIQDAEVRKGRAT